jgi:hypothetical protein
MPHGEPSIEGRAVGQVEAVIQVEPVVEVEPVLSPQRLLADGDDARRLAVLDHAPRHAEAEAGDDETGEGDCLLDRSSHLWLLAQSMGQDSMVSNIE